LTILFLVWDNHFIPTKTTWLAPTREDTVFVRISPSCRHCLRTN